MNEKEFVYWFKGVADSIGRKGPTAEQWDTIQHELALVFNKVTPYRPNTEPTKAEPQKKSISETLSERFGPARRLC